MHVSLPPELWTKVACQLDSVPDRPDLCSLARVSSMLRDVAQAELYRTLLINDRRCGAWLNFIALLTGQPVTPDRPRDPDPDENTVDDEPNLEGGEGGMPNYDEEPWSANDIFDQDSFEIMATFDENPHLGKLVKTIMYSGNPDGRSVDGAFVRVLKACPNINEIAIMAMCRSPGGSQYGATRAIAEHRPTLQKLALAAFKCPAARRALQHLFAFTSLEVLSFDGIEYDLDKPRNLRPFESKLSQLRTDVPFASWLIPYLTCPSPESLTSLDFTVDEPFDLSPYPNLDRLSLEFSHHPILTETLSTLPRTAPLKKFKLKKIFMDDEIVNEETFHHVPKQVYDDLLPPTALESINLDFPLSRDGEGSLGGILGGLRDKKWKRLRRLKLRLREEGSRQRDRIADEDRQTDDSLDEDYMELVHGDTDDDESEASEATSDGDAVMVEEDDMVEDLAQEAMNHESGNTGYLEGYEVEGGRTRLTADALLEMDKTSTLERWKAEVDEICAREGIMVQWETYVD